MQTRSRAARKRVIPFPHRAKRAAAEGPGGSPCRQSLRQRSSFRPWLFSVRSKARARSLPSRSQPDTAGWSRVQEPSPDFNGIAEPNERGADPSPPAPLPQGERGRLLALAPVAIELTTSQSFSPLPSRERGGGEGDRTSTVTRSNGPRLRPPRAAPIRSPRRCTRSIPRLFPFPPNGCDRTADEVPAHSRSSHRDPSRRRSNRRYRDLRSSSFRQSRSDGQLGARKIGPTRPPRLVGVLQRVDPPRLGRRPHR